MQVAFLDVTFFYFRRKRFKDLHNFTVGYQSRYQYDFTITFVPMRIKE